MKRYWQRVKNSDYLGITGFLSLLIVLGFTSNKSISTLREVAIISGISVGILWSIFFLSHIRFRK